MVAQSKTDGVSAGHLALTFQFINPLKGEADSLVFRFAALRVRAVTMVFPLRCLQWLPNSLQGKCGRIQKALLI